MTRMYIKQDFIQFLCCIVIMLIRQDIQVDQQHDLYYIQIINNAIFYSKKLLQFSTKYITKTYIQSQLQTNKPHQNTYYINLADLKKLLRRVKLQLLYCMNKPNLVNPKLNYKKNIEDENIDQMRYQYMFSPIKSCIINKTQTKYIVSKLPRVLIKSRIKQKIDVGKTLNWKDWILMNS